MVDVDGRVNHAVFEGRQIPGKLQRSGRAHGVPDVAFGVVDSSLGEFAEDVSKRRAFLGIARRRAGRVSADDVDVGRLEPGFFERQIHALGLTFWVWQNKIGRVGVHRIADQFADDVGVTFLGITEPLEHIQTTAFGDHDPVSLGIKRTRRFGRVVVSGQGILRIEAGKDPKGVNRFARPAGDRHVAFFQTQHLRPLDDPRVAGRTGRTDRIVRPGDSQIQCDLAGGIVGHRARIVVMRPNVGVVIETFDHKDFVFRFHVPVLGHTDIDSDSAAIDIFPINTARGDRLVGRIDTDTAGPGAAADIFFGLVFFIVKIANARQRFSEISNFVRPHAAATGQQRFSIGIPIVPVGGGQSDPGDDDPLRIGKRGGAIRGDQWRMAGKKRVTKNLGDIDKPFVDDGSEEFIRSPRFGQTSVRFPPCLGPAG